MDTAAAQDVTLARLQDQIDWYDKKSASAQSSFKRLKIATIVAAALVPVLAGVKGPAIVTGALGALIVVFEGVQSLYQFHTNWFAYRSTCEALKHEKFLYHGGAGPYRAAPDPHALLAERIESLVSQEHAKWASGQERAKGDFGPTVER